MTFGFYLLISKFSFDFDVTKLFCKNLRISLGHQGASKTSSMPYKMPTVKQFLEKKRLHDPKKEPVWVYLEKEMRANENKKPYNHKVGDWLKFLKDLKIHYHNEDVRAKKRLIREVGPSWYVELSNYQRNILAQLRDNLHQDLIEQSPVRVRKALFDLGITLKIPRALLMEAMRSSVEDPGVFMWNLYTAVFKTPPSYLRHNYDLNAMFMMSSLVFIDLEECVQRLEDLTRNDAESILKPEPPEPQNYKPDIKFGEYLEKCYARCYSPKLKGRSNKPKPINYRFKMRTQESYERLIKNHGFLEKRIERNRKEMQPERVCKYKFWEPPTALRTKDPKMRAYLEKLKMFKKKAKKKFNTPFVNLQFNITGVSYIGGKPHYTLANVVSLPTGYVPINGGYAQLQDDMICINILGYFKYPRDEIDACDETCDCMKWEGAVMKYLEQSKCRCGHMYDFYNEGKMMEKYFYPPTAHGPLWFDYAKIYQMDPMEDFIKTCVDDAVRSKDPTPTASNPTISASGLKLSDLLSIFLADLSDTPLLIPHLPQANMLNNLKEWVRKRVFGKMTPAKHKQLSLQSLRRWLDLSHIDFTAKAYFIPFTLKELKHMTWAHRKLVQTLFRILLEDFMTRNRVMQMQQTRLWWPTTKYDLYPFPSFLDVYFTYMPARMKDTHLLNPYSPINISKNGGKTCPLQR